MKTPAWAVTAFMCGFFALPHVSASQPNPTNTWQFANHKSVAVNQVTNVVPEATELQPTTQDRKFLGPMIFFAIVLAVTAYIIYQLIKLLDKVIPPPDKKPDAPPSSGNTNYPPVVINPTTGPGPATASLRAKNLIIDSNTPSWGPVQYYDIAALNYQNDSEKFATRVNYDGFWSTGMTVSTNLVDWEDSHYRIDCYVCSSVGAVRYVYYHYGTNFWNCYYTGAFVATNHAAPAWFNLSDRPYQLKQFFRLDPK